VGMFQKMYNSFTSVFTLSIDTRLMDGECTAVRAPNYGDSSCV